jgi:urea transporter
MANRHVPIITGVVCLSIGAALIIVVGSWWAWILGSPFVIYGWICLKLGVTMSDDELSAVTGRAAISDAMNERIKHRVDDVM